MDLNALLKKEANGEDVSEKSESSSTSAREAFLGITDEVYNALHGDRRKSRNRHLSDRAIAQRNARLAAGEKDSDDCDSSSLANGVGANGVGVGRGAHGHGHGSHGHVGIVFGGPSFVGSRAALSAHELVAGDARSRSYSYYSSSGGSGEGARTAAELSEAKEAKESEDYSYYETES